MDDEQFIRTLLKSHRAVPRSALPLGLLLNVAAGLAAAVAIIALSIGVRADFAAAAVTSQFLMKGAYALMLGLGALLGVARLARPDAGEQRWLWLLFLPAAGMAALAVMEAWLAPPGSWREQWQGSSWRVCTFLIAGFSVPLFLAMIHAFRRFAPTQLRLAGFLAGLASGGLSALAYALHCPEESAVFVAIWYSAGIAIPAIVGAVAGPRLLRW